MPSLLPPCPDQPLCTLFATTVCSVAVALAGCAHQRHELRPLDPAAAQAAWQAASPDDTATREALSRQGIATTPWPLPAWDADALTALALARHPDMALARAELAEAQAAQAAALQRAGRTAELVTERHSDTADGRSPWSLGVVFDGFATGAAQRAARGDEAQALATQAGFLAAQTAWQVRQRVRRAHRELYFAQQAAQAAEAVLQQRAALTTSAQRRLAQGAADAGDLLLVQQGEADARSQALQAQDAVVRARSSLAAAIDLPLARTAALPLRFDDLQRDATALPPSEDLQGQALLNRLDVRSAVARYAAADAALRLELARQWPDMVLRPGFLWDQGDRVWSLGLGITWPPGGRNQAAIAAAQARRESEAARFAGVQSAALAALDAARAAAAAATAQREAAQTRWLRAQQATRRAEQRLAAGSADRAELLVAGVAAAEAAGQWTAARAAWWATHGQLEDALQSPLPPGSP